MIDHVVLNRYLMRDTFNVGCKSAKGVRRWHNGSLSSGNKSESSKEKEVQRKSERRKNVIN